MASTYLTKSFASSGNRKKFTFSMWVKRANISNSFCIFNQHYSSNNNNSYIGFNSDDTLSFWSYSSSYQMNLKTSAKYRDTNGWYHIVCVADTEQATSSNRAKLYVNGVEPALGTATYPSQNQDLNFNSDETQQIGVYRYGSSNYYFYDGCLSHFHFCDGYAYTSSDFGETDSTTGEWKIKTSPSVSYGTNGYWILKDGNSVTDQSPNTNNWTVTGGTLTKTEDCPSNIFATFNPLNVPTSNIPVFAHGNTDLDSCPNAGRFRGSSTLGMLSGKFYAEFKWKSGSYPIVGVTSRARNDARENKRPGAENGSYGFEMYNGNVKVNSSTIGGFSGSSLTTNDILGIAIDCDNNKIYFRKNGDAWMNSGDPTSGSTGTGALSLTAATGGDYDGFWFFVIGDGDSSSSSKISANFGNGSFKSTAVSSAGTNASGIGIFEYDVPAGYTALSTKGLNE